MTSSLIAIKKENGLFDAIYCHHDGYPEGVGVTLKKHYTTEEKINELINLGYLISLGEKIGEKVDDNQYGQHKGQCVAYYRDGEDDEKLCAIDLSFIKFLEYCDSFYCIDYIYIFINNQWETFKAVDCLDFYKKAMGKANGDKEND